MSQLIFPDNTVLCNFAAVNRLDLLRDWLRGRGRWTDAVAYEVRNSARHLVDLAQVPAEGWLGDPIELDDEVVLERVERIRRVVFGGTQAKPLQHLGEAQTCFLITEIAEYAGAWWISDDRDAFEYAQQRGIQAYRTLDVMRHIVADGDLTAQQAYDLIRAMADRGRALYVPAQVRELW